MSESKELALALPGASEWDAMKKFGLDAVKSGMIPSSIKSPEAAAIIILKGRELGLKPMESLENIHVINGKPTLSAQIMLTHIYKEHPDAEIEIERKDDVACIIKAKRKGGKKLVEFKWDADRARKMNLMDKDNYKKQPGTMFFWRAVSEMKRTLWPEILSGANYDPSELEEIDVTNTIHTPLKEVVIETIQEVATDSKVENISKVHGVKNHAPTFDEPETIDVDPEPQEEPKAKVVDKAKLRKEVGAAIAKAAKEAGLSADQLKEFVMTKANKKQSDLTTSEMEQVLDLLKIEIAKKETP